MAGVNKVLLIGNLGRDPELRYTERGTPVATLSLATTERWKGRDGAQGERTEWHRVVAWGATGEAASRHLAKGSKAYVEGRLQTRQWEDRDGEKRRVVEVVASHVVFLDGGQSAPTQGRSAAPTSSGSTTRSGSSGPVPPPDDGIPF